MGFIERDLRQEMEERRRDFAAEDRRSSTGRAGTPDKPVYTKGKQANSKNLWYIQADEGWKTSVLCVGMYEWQADWLLSLIQYQPMPPDAERR